MLVLFDVFFHLSLRFNILIVLLIALHSYFFINHCFYCILKPYFKTFRVDFLILNLNFLILLVFKLAYQARVPSFNSFPLLILIVQSAPMHKVSFLTHSYFFLEILLLLYCLQLLMKHVLLFILEIFLRTSGQYVFILKRELLHFIEKNFILFLKCSLHCGVNKLLLLNIFFFFDDSLIQQAFFYKK